MLSQKKYRRIKIRYIPYLPSMVATHFVRFPLSWNLLLYLLLVCLSVVCYITKTPHLYNLYMYGVFIIPLCLYSITQSRAVKLNNGYAWVMYIALLTGSLAFAIRNLQLFVDLYSKIEVGYPTFTVDSQEILSFLPEAFSVGAAFTLPFLSMKKLFMTLKEFYAYKPFSSWNKISVDRLKLDRSRFVVAAFITTLYISVFVALVTSRFVGITFPTVVHNLLLIGLSIVYSFPIYLYASSCEPDSVFSKENQYEDKVAAALGHHLLILTKLATPFNEMKKQSTSTIINNIYANVRHIFCQTTLDDRETIQQIIQVFSTKLISYKQSVTWLRSKKTKMEANTVFHHCFFALGVSIARLAQGDTFDAQRYRNDELRNIVESLYFKEQDNMFKYSLLCGYKIGELYQILKNKDVSEDASFQQLFAEAYDHFQKVCKTPLSVQYNCLITEMSSLNKSGVQMPNLLPLVGNERDAQEDLFKTIISELVKNPSVSNGVMSNDPSSEEKEVA